MEKKMTSTNRINNMVNYTIEEADAALETMTETILSEFNVACDKIDAEYEKSEIKRISQLSKSMMIQESQSWRPSQWAAYLSKGNTFDDTELDRYIEEELIER